MVTIASMTSSPEELEHAAGPNWRDVTALPEKKEAEATEEVVETAAESETAEEVESEKPKSKGGLQKRFDKLTRRAYEAETRAKAAERRTAELEARITSNTPAAKEPAKSDEPNWDDYANNGKPLNEAMKEFLAARDTWKEAEAEKQAVAAEAQAITDEYEARKEEARAKYDDWDEVFDEADQNKLVISEKITEAIIECGRPEVAYYLAKHPEELETLEGMRKTATAARIYEIAKEMNPSAKRSPEKKEKQQKPKPPEPIATVGASSARSNVPLDQLDPKDYIKVMNKRERERRF